MKNIEVVAAIFRKANTIFATEKGYGEFKGYWEFPGGEYSGLFYTIVPARGYR